MDWPNERFVKLYTRDTDDWLLLSWQARAVFTFILRKVDRAGVLETKRGALGVAALIGMPPDVVESALATLIADGCISEHTRGYLLRNFMEAQDAAQSDRLRAAASRDRRRLGMVTEGHTPSREVTNRDADGDDVTRCHAASLQTRQTDETDRKRASARGPGLADRATEFATVAVGEINAHAGTAYRPSAKQTIKDSQALVKAGHTIEQARRVIAAKWAEWKTSSKRDSIFVPSTLLRPSNFDRYLEELEGKAGALRTGPASRQAVPDAIVLDGQTYPSTDTGAS